MNVLLILLGKSITLVSRFLNLGHGSTWPGHVALTINKNFIKEILNNNRQLKIILIAGTNGKTTTGKLIQTILKKTHYRVFQNESGANLLNGIASSLLLHSSILSTINYDYAIFEVDENTLPLALKEITPDYLILLNLFRDQLDRYGEVNTIAKKWQRALSILTKTLLVLNADDPQISYLGIQSRPPGRWIRSGTFVFYFGLDDKKLHQKSHQHAVDSTYCLNCNSKLYYNTIYYSHLGDWQCHKCNLNRPFPDLSNTEYYPIPGVYNKYNIHAAVLCAKTIGVGNDVIKKALKEFNPVFGRQEMLDVNGKKVQFFLSKNPVSFNESLRTIASMQAKTVLLVLNDRIPDGKDVSWIWDVDFEDYIDKLKNIILSGDRAYDMALRIKYATQTQTSNVKSQNYNVKLRGNNVALRKPKFKTYEHLKEAISQALKVTSENEVLYILPTYSAMLEARRILTGRKIL